MKKMAALIAVAAAIGLAPRHAAAQQQTAITCESRSGQRQICRVNTEGGVSIRRQFSSTNCVQGRNWGYTRNAIWVDDGCRAEFAVNNTSGQYNDGYNNGRYNNGRYDNGGYDNDGYNNRNANAANVACRRAVRAQLGRRVEVNTWAMNGSRNNARVGWRLANGRSGECRIDRNGNVSVLVNRNR